MKILITGTAGFIGFHLAKRLLKEGHEVLGLDLINDYYDINLKYNRLEKLGIKKQSIAYGKTIRSIRYPGHSFVKMALEDTEAVMSLFKKEKFEFVCHLAAQAGVRYSLSHPRTYIKSNIDGFMNIVEGCRHNICRHLIYASSSSVYGANKKLPFSTSDNVDHPVSLYAATKKSNELIAHTYSHLYDIPTTGLRFFTVYGPWGRPDMALFLFTKAMIEKKPIDVFNYGNMKRDFTYIDDIVEGIFRLTFNPPEKNPECDFKNPDPATSNAPYRVFNIGNNRPVKLLDFITAIEKELDVEAEKNMMPLQPGDVPQTCADVSDLKKAVGYHPSTSVNEGIKKFISWYRSYYEV
ncbi:MAG: NAD-dependent epimerase [bacterium]